MKRYARIRKKEGMGTVELMVSMSILTLLAVAGARTFDATQELLTWNSYQLELQSELRRTLDTMAREIREASVTGPVPLASVTVTPGSNSFAFAIPNAVSGNTVTQWTQVRYFLCPNTERAVGRVASPNALPLSYTCPVLGQTILGSRVEQMDFIYSAATAPRTIQIQITGSRLAATTTLKRDLRMTVASNVTLRNP